MSAFDFFVLLLSFVVSLGLTSLLSSIVRLLQAAERVKFSWAYALWVAAVFNLQITFWLKTWTYHDTYSMSISNSAPPLILAIIAYLACGLATPQVPHDGQIDLHEFHERQGRKYQIAYCLFMVAAIFQGAVMGDFRFDVSSLPPEVFAMAATAAIVLLAAIFWRTGWIQIGVAAICVAANISFYVRLIRM